MKCPLLVNHLCPNRAHKSYCTTEGKILLQKLPTREAEAQISTKRKPVQTRDKSKRLEICIYCISNQGYTEFVRQWQKDGLKITHPPPRRQINPLILHIFTEFY